MVPASDSLARAIGEKFYISCLRESDIETSAAMTGRGTKGIGRSWRLEGPHPQSLSLSVRLGILQTASSLSQVPDRKIKNSRKHTLTGKKKYK